jgi:translation initiation factor IF-2
MSPPSLAGIDDLLEAILIQAEVLELKAVVDGMANGVVIESFLDKGRGQLLHRAGTETCVRGDIVLCGLEYGRVRAMRDELGREIKEAGPSLPVEILGLSGVPSAGDEATVVRDEKKAREVALYRQGKFREVKLARQQKAKLENMFANMTEGEVSEVNVVIKADVQGSVEAICDALVKLSTDEVKVKIVGSGVGGITETDATLARLPAPGGLQRPCRCFCARSSRSESLDLRYYSVIYDLIDEVKQAMSGMLLSIVRKSSVWLKCAACSSRRSLAPWPAVWSPKVWSSVPTAFAFCVTTWLSMKASWNPCVASKDDVNEVKNGYECGIAVKNYNDVREGDQIEVYETVEIQRTL